MCFKVFNIFIFHMFRILFYLFEVCKTMQRTKCAKLLI